ncbi:MAG TPA: hypothetical protein VGJ00_08410 [Rhabdochlamydiaceae bacterium]|jgi:hypothetical protein
MTKPKPLLPHNREPISVVNNTWLKCPKISKNSWCGRGVTIVCKGGGAVLGLLCGVRTSFVISQFVLSQLSQMPDDDCNCKNSNAFAFKTLSPFTFIGLTLCTTAIGMKAGKSVANWILD